MREPAAFRVRAWRFHFRALEPLRFPAYRAANSIRGVLGTGLDERIFRPRSISGPSGLRTPPPPFVLRAHHLNHAVIAVDDPFHVDINTFDRDGTVAEEIARSFASVTGCRFRFERAELHRDFTVGLASPEPARHALIHFVTPTALKGCTELRRSIPFSALLSRARDRIATLRRLYGDGPLDIDFRGLGARAEKIENVSWEQTKYVFVSRRSSRTGQVHGIGGILGSAEYEGDLAEFVPWLRAACWTGVGRHTVWGNGQIECEFVV